jgi:hypothetical protein
MIRRNKLERYQAIPAAIMKLENGKWVVYWVVEVPVVESCVLWLVEKSTAGHAVMMYKLEFHTDTVVEGSVFAILKNLHNSEWLLVLKVGWFGHPPLTTSRSKYQNFDETAVVRSRTRFFFRVKEKGSRLCSHVLVRYSIELVIPPIAGLKETSHNLACGLRPRIRPPRRDVPAIHEELEVIPLRVRGSCLDDAISNPESSACDISATYDTKILQTYQGPKGYRQTP